MQLRFANRVQKVQSSAIRDLLRYGTDPSIISFGGGYPDPTLFPSGKLRALYDTLHLPLRASLRPSSRASS